MSKSHFSLEFDCGDTSLWVHDASVRETISRPFSVNIVARSEKVDLDLGAFVGESAGMALTADLGPLGWSGIVQNMSQLAAGDDTDLSTYEISLVPRLWLLTQRQGYRIFQHQNTPDIVSTFLNEFKIEFELNLSDDYPKHEYRVQYAEPDLNFVSRLLEEAGISYYFARRGSERIRSVLVLTDKPHQSPLRVGELPWRDVSTGRAADEAHVADVMLTHKVCSGKTTIRDFDFRKPDFDLVDRSELALEGEQAIELTYERYYHRPGASRIEVAGAPDVLPRADDKSITRHDAEQLKKVATITAEAARHNKRTVRFRSNHPALCPGALVSIGGHFRDELSEDLLIVGTGLALPEVRTESYQITARVEAVLVDPAVPYRSPIAPRKPRAGVQTAVVVGLPEPEREIDTDEFGRVRVQFSWDREGAHNDDSSCWLRVSQSWAGGAYGSMHAPRIGQEVIVDFLEGDPDQPLVIGRVYNQTQVVPRPLPLHESQSIWRSATSPQSDNCFNEIMFQDSKGDQLYFMQAERDLQRLVKRLDTERIGQDQNVVVEKGRVAAIGRRDHLQVGEQMLVKMVEPAKLHGKSLADPELVPGKTWFEMIDNKITLTTGEATIILDGPNISIEGSGGMRFGADGRVIMTAGQTLLNATQAQIAAASAQAAEPAEAKKGPTRELPAVSHLFGSTVDAFLGIPPDKGSGAAIKLPPIPPPDNVVLHGSDEFKAKAKADLEKISMTPAGQALFKRIEARPHIIEVFEPSHRNDFEAIYKAQGPVTLPDDKFLDAMPNIKKDPDGEYFADWGGSAPGDGLVRTAIGEPGKGTKAAIIYEAGKSFPQSPNTPPDVALFHELAHATRMTEGESKGGLMPPNEDGTSYDKEWVSAWADQEEYEVIQLENDYRRESGLGYERHDHSTPLP